jgi:hypothetical protein
MFKWQMIRQLIGWSMCTIDYSSEGVENRKFKFKYFHRNDSSSGQYVSFVWRQYNLSRIPSSASALTFTGRDQEMKAQEIRRNLTVTTNWHGMVAGFIDDI